MSAAAEITRYLHRDMDRDLVQLPFVCQVVVARTPETWFLHVTLEGERQKTIEVRARFGPRLLDLLLPPAHRMEDVT